MSWYTVGHVKEPHGLKGDLYIYVKSGESYWLDELTELRLKKPHSDDYEIYKIIKKKPFKKGIHIHIDGVEDRNQSEAIKGYEVQIPEELLTSKEGESVYLKEIINFEVYIEESICVGEIIGFGGSTFQDLIIVKNSFGEYEIPLVDEFIVNIDYENNRIDMKLPEGLIEYEN